MPKRVAKEIIRLQRRFLWSGSSEKRFSALVKWDIVQRPKKQGGLGVGDLLIRNAALLFKWWWRFACEEGAMWKRVVHSIHEEDQVLLPMNIDSSLPGPWKDIKRAALANSPTAKAFFDNLAVKVGNGSRVKFWLAVWAHEKPLKEVFPRLFRLSSQQDEIIANMGWFEGNLWRWTLVWKQEPTADEQVHIIQLQTMLQQHPPVQNGNDQLLWCGKPSFCTRSLVTEALRISLSNVAVDNLVSTVWKNIAPPKVEFMVWLALLGKLHTKELLLRKGLRTSDDILCCFCSTHIETSDHLLVCCQISWHIWSMIAAT